MLTRHRTMKALAIAAAAGLWLAAAPAAAQRAVPRDGGSSSQGSGGQRSPSGGSSSGGGSASSGGSSTQDAGRSQPRESGSSSAPQRGDQSGARERGSRPGIAQAVPRVGPVPPPRGDDDHDHYYGSPVYGYPWGYGGIGIYGGYYGGYYDPWWWSNPWWYGPAYGPGYGPAYGYGTYVAHYGDSAVRLDVKPRGASVYVDGYYAGVVDDFDGFFQRLHLDSGGHRIEFRMDGYETLSVDLYLQPDRTITYHGELTPQGARN